MHGAEQFDERGTALAECVAGGAEFLQQFLIRDGEALVACRVPVDVPDDGASDLMAVGQAEDAADDEAE